MGRKYASHGFWWVPWPRRAPLAISGLYVWWKLSQGKSSFYKNLMIAHPDVWWLELTLYQLISLLQYSREGLEKKYGCFITPTSSSHRKRKIIALYKISYCKSQVPSRPTWVHMVSQILYPGTKHTQHPSCAWGQCPVLHSPICSWGKRVTGGQGRNITFQQAYSS